MTERVPHRTAATLWADLVERGLIVPGYDADLFEHVRGKLEVESSFADFASALERAGATPTWLVDTLIKGMQPFTRMVSDLLELYAEVGAKSATGESLRLEYEFDPEMSWTFLLAEFREHERRLRTVIERRRLPVVNANALWQLSEAVQRDSDAADGASLAGFRSAYDTGHWPDQVPRPPRTGYPDADEAIELVTETVSWFLATARTRWTGSEELRQERRARIGVPEVAPDDELEFFGSVDSDRWPYFALRGAFLSAQAIVDLQRGEPGDARTAAAALADRINLIVAPLPHRDVDVEAQVQELLDILALPEWGKRHELYAAWVFGEIVRALTMARVTVHVADGVLAFRFGGSHVATVATSDGPAEVWAELRSPYEVPADRTGRSKAIQPDYRITRPPVTSPSATILAVECKQYLRSAKKNPGQALADYTGGLPRATVILAAHGPVSASVTDLVPESRRDRAEVVRFLRPGNEGSEAVTRFRQLVAAAIPAPTDTVAQPTVVVLRWSASVPDLDLHAWVRRSDGSVDHIFHGGRGSDGDVWLDRDVRTGLGPETITIATKGVEVDIWVAIYSDGFNYADAQVTVTLSSGRTQLRTTPSDSAASGRWWHVATVMADGVIAIQGGRPMVERPVGG